MIYTTQYHSGDKDVFWMACYLTDEDCALNPWAMGTFGRAKGDIVRWIMYAITQFHPYEIEEEHPRLISVQGWITRLNIDKDKFQNETFNSFIDQNFTFSAPMPYSEQLSRIINGETFKLNAQMKKVMNPEYERREVQNFIELARRRNKFARMGRGMQF